jgi:hypothetical protein
VLGFDILVVNEEIISDIDVDKVVVHIADKFYMVVVNKWAFVVANIEARVAYIKVDIAMNDSLVVVGNTLLV